MNRRYSFSNKTLWLKGRIFRPSPDVWLLLKGPSNCTQRRRVNIGNIATAAHSLRLYLSLSASQHIVLFCFVFCKYTPWKQWHIRFYTDGEWIHIRATGSRQVRGQCEHSSSSGATQTWHTSVKWFPTWRFISWQIVSLITGRLHHRHLPHCEILPLFVCKLVFIWLELCIRQQLR